MSLNPCQCKYDYIIAKYFLTKYLFTLIINLDVSAADAEELGLHVSRVRVPKVEPLDEVGADRGPGRGPGSPCSGRAERSPSCWRPPVTRSSQTLVRGAALAHRVNPRLHEDLLSVLRDPQRLVQSVHIERHLLPAAPQ